AGSTSDAILDLVGRLAARLHEEAQAVVDQQAAAATAQRQLVRAEVDKLATDVVALRAELEQAQSTLASVRAAHADTQTALQ
ncbi:integrase, partial [Acinetobacter baumannii]|nr:integrase [Acinetobacter baumannii]